MVFNFFRPKLPLGVREKAWIETRLGWLAEQLGVRRLLDARLLTSDDQLCGAPYEATPAGARRLLDHLCGLVHLEPARIQLQVNPDDKRSRFVCGFAPGRFEISEAHLREPQWLIPMLARGLGHQILLTLDPASTAHDRDWVADLLPVFHGLGIVVANAAGSEKGVFGANYSLRRLVKAGNLSARAVGYALALFAWARQETQLEWSSYLRPDAADVFRNGLRYLEATEDTVFDPLHNRLGLGRDCPRQLSAYLADGTPTARIAALWELARRGPAGAETVEQMHQCLSDSLPEIRAEAARALAEAGPAAGPALPELLAVLSDARADARAAAAYALGRLKLQPELVVPELARCLDDGPTEDATLAALLALAQYGPAAAPALPAITVQLHRAATTTHYALADYATHAIGAIDADAERTLHAVVESCDVEIRRQAAALIAAARRRAGTLVSPGAWFGLTGL